MGLLESRLDGGVTMPHVECKRATLGHGNCRSPPLSLPMCPCLWLALVAKVCSKADGQPFGSVQRWSQLGQAAVSIGGGNGCRGCCGGRD